MEWTCENCNTVKNETGTSFGKLKVCTRCFHELEARAERCWKRVPYQNAMALHMRGVPIYDIYKAEIISQRSFDALTENSVIFIKDPDAKDTTPVVENPQHRSNIVNVAHYSGWAVDEFIEAQGLGFRLGNVVKYVVRAGKKDQTKEIEDLEKARAYLSREILRRRLKAGLPEEPEKK